MFSITIYKSAKYKTKYFLSPKIILTKKKIQKARKNKKKT